MYSASELRTAKHCVQCLPWTDISRCPWCRLCGVAVVLGAKRSFLHTPELFSPQFIMADNAAAADGEEGVQDLTMMVQQLLGQMVRASPRGLWPGLACRAALSVLCLLQRRWIELVYTRRPCTGTLSETALLPPERTFALGVLACNTKKNGLTQSGVWSVGRAEFDFDPPVLSAR